MNNDTALVALQAIDVIVYKSGHKALSAEDLADLQGACTSLIQSTEGNSSLAKKAADIVHRIQATALGGAPRQGLHREEILQSGILLSILIQKHSEAGSDVEGGAPR